MFSTDDTIVAIATPPGRGGIGVVRLSGPAAHAITSRLVSVDGGLEPRRATLAIVRPDEGSVAGIDQCIATYFVAPASFTGDHVVELSLHGSPVILRTIVAAAVRYGARLAEPGEFTFRAYLNGRLDLTQAEAVGDLIDAVTPLQARAAFDQLQGTVTRAVADIDGALFDLIARLEASVDFPEEGYHFDNPATLAAAIDALIQRSSALAASGQRGRLVREGLQIAIVGAPNAGKSSLFNVLAGAARAIVTEVPGTTRDLVTDVIDLEGLRVTLVDTAGLRFTTDTVESEGVARSKGVAAVADLLLFVADGSAPWPEEAARIVGVPSAGPQDPPYVTSDAPEDVERGMGRTALSAPVIVLRSKSDLPSRWQRAGSVAVSAVTGEGMDGLRRAILQALDVEQLSDRPEITNVRHLALVERARDALVRARTALGDAPLSEEFVLADLQDARAALEEITGRRTPDDVLAHIFSRFCIGK